jgi:hypothetical protein
MILVDTSVWVDHLRRGNARLAALLQDAQVAIHAFVIGEVACEALRNRRELLALLGRLPHVAEVSHEEALGFLHARRLAGRGLGWIDLHLLAAAALARLPLWTLDRRLANAARDLGLYGSPG